MNQKERIRRYLQLLSDLNFAQRYYDFYERSPHGEYARFGTRSRVEDALRQAGLDDVTFDGREKGLRYRERYGVVEFVLDAYFSECTMHYFLTVKTPDWKLRGGCEILAWEVAKLDDPGFEPDPMYPKLWFNDAPSLQEVANFGAVLFHDVRDVVLASELVDGLETRDDPPDGASNEGGAKTAPLVQIGDEEPGCRLFSLDPAITRASLSDRDSVAAAIEAAADTLDLGQAWAGLHVVLTGEPPIPRPKAIELGVGWSEEPLQDALMGGEPTPLLGSYGPYRLLDADQTERAAHALEAIRLAKFESLYDPDELDELQVSAGPWHDPAYRRWLSVEFERLRTWYIDVAAQGAVVLIVID